jgi:hypothetical protein
MLLGTNVGGRITGFLKKLIIFLAVDTDEYISTQRNI